MLLPVLKILFLNKYGKCPATFSEGFAGLLNWICLTQDTSRDGGSSAGYSLRKKWLISYPETTGYLIWTLINHYKLFGDASWLGLAEKMAKWEQAVQWKEGGIPGSYRQASEQMVVFNTGMVIMGWSAYYRETKNDLILQSAIRAADWIISCQDDNGIWSRNFSPAVSGGNLTLNTMVAWGLSELYLATGLKRLRESALRATNYYAQFVGAGGWPDHGGLSDDKDRNQPLTHTLGYTLSGFYETGALLNDKSSRDVALRISAGLERIVTKDGFIPGRVMPGFKSHVRWACLTGSAQIAYTWLRMVEDGAATTDLLEKALSVVDFVRRSQRKGTGNVGIDYGVAGSYPFSFSGYCRLTYPNWAAKFTVDCYHLLHKLSKTETYGKKLEAFNFDKINAASNV